MKFAPGLVAVLVLAAAGSARADVILNYDFSTPVAWVSNSPGYAPDGGTLSGSFTFDWTTHTVSNVDLTTTAATSGTPATATFTDMSTNGGPYTYTGTPYTYDGVSYTDTTQYEEITGNSGGQQLFVDFTELTTSEPFPGLLTGVHSSEDGNTRVLAITVDASEGGTGTSAPEPASMTIFVSGMLGLLPLRKRLSRRA